MMRPVRIVPGTTSPAPPEPTTAPPPLLDLFPFLCFGEASNYLLQLFTKRSTSNSSSTSIEYYKKDVAYSYTTVHNSAVRLQFHALTSQHNNHSDILLTEWPTLLRKKRGVLLILPFPEHNMAQCIEQLYSWKEWLDVHVQLPTSVILVVQSQSSQQRSRMFWARLGAKLQALCDELQLVGWHIYGDDEFDGEDAIFRSVVEETRKAELDLRSSPQAARGGLPPATISVPQATTASTRTTPSSSSK